MTDTIRSKPHTIADIVEEIQGREAFVQKPANPMSKNSTDSTEAEPHANQQSAQPSPTRPTAPWTSIATAPAPKKPSHPAEWAPPPPAPIPQYLPPEPEPEPPPPPLPPAPIPQPQSKPSTPAPSPTHEIAEIQSGKRSRIAGRAIAGGLVAAAGIGVVVAFSKVDVPNFDNYCSSRGVANLTDTGLQRNLTNPAVAPIRAGNVTVSVYRDRVDTLLCSTMPLPESAYRTGAIIRFDQFANSKPPQIYSLSRPSQIVTTGKFVNITADAWPPGYLIRIKVRDSNAATDNKFAIQQWKGTKTGYLAIRDTATGKITPLTLRITNGTPTVLREPTISELRLIAPDLQRIAAANAIAKPQALQ